MDAETLRELLERVRAGKVSVEAALKRLKRLPVDDLGFARLDSHRALRKGFPEVVYCEGKRPAEVVAIVHRLLETNANLLATRATPALYRAIKKRHPKARYNERARTIVVEKRPLAKTGGMILVVTAGTSDIDVAEEAAETAAIMGNRVERLYDVGVAGIHRLLRESSLLEKASVVVVVAGMEGALPSVVAGLVDKPVIGVPTSRGYGTSFGGIAALLAMLNACASGLTVVNIDNGFGAGYAAAVMNRLTKRPS